jgi:hypothetical protein
MKNLDSKCARDDRTQMKRCFHPTHVCLGKELVIQKMANKLQESRLVEITSKSVNGFGVVSS